MTTPTAPDPNDAVGTVFMVPKDSPVKTVADMKGLRAASNFERGFSGVYVPLGEIAAQGFNPDNFFKEIVPAGSPMKRLLLAVQRGEADVAMARACTVEELQQTEPEFVAQFRPVGLKPEKGRFACLRSTELYPNWTFVATTMAPWQASRDFTAALLSMPATEGGVAWGVASDFLRVDELYKTLKAGPYAYLRIQSVGDFFPTLLAFHCTLFDGGCRPFLAQPTRQSPCGCAYARAAFGHAKGKGCDGGDAKHQGAACTV